MPETPNHQDRLLHATLLLTGAVGRIHPLLLSPLWLGLSGLAGWPWWIKSTLGPAAALLTLTAILADGVSLTLLPRLKRSFGPPTPPLLALAVVRALITSAGGLVWPTPLGLVVIATIQVVILLAEFYATWVEPSRIGVTHARLRSPKLNGYRPLRLLHITDLHVERITLRERQLLRLVEELAPDVIVMTGDYVNLSFVRDPHAHTEARTILERLCQAADGPVYAVTGSPPVDRADVIPSIFDGLPITWLQDQAIDVDLNGHAVRLVGVSCTRERHIDAPRLGRLLEQEGHQSTSDFTLLLYHSPDLMPEAVKHGVDLYLCGHTHGGQIRLPLFGALVTSSDFWKRYAMGRYTERDTTLYVSRGLGMEGMGAPRARFLAPPEVVIWTLSS